ncbi:AMP-binding protein [Nocardioides panzhihuensis]|uniref:Acyl-CoA synthetase (AMP-forming)/AMP-acid ligase II n=1 Tax=Nocardioides panzhihuensis TaxID=860243 RepID=A0A7Z0DHT9_9ACTN|nr:AMP-binding protein [Nocardioides panzhihuensis]NYI75556.1 acyl-CoA synthetase (AMP-forming)/AMP-acid ligase II [Nocardioides panzhihuensis]
MHLSDLAGTHGAKPAVIDGSTGETLSFTELEAASNRIARAFEGLGLRHGDHVAILAENTLDLFPVVWAAQRSGLLYTPVNWHLAADEAAYIVENCGARVLLHTEHLAELAGVIAAAVSLEHRITIDGRAAGGESLLDLTDGLSTEPRENESEGYYMLYSSGTTGRPKGILPSLPDEPFGTGIQIDHMMADNFGFDDSTVYLSPGPLYHAAPLGWSLGTTRNGGTVVMMGKFDAELCLQLIARHGVTHGQFVPTMFVRMLKLPGAVRTAYDVSSLRLVIHAAAPCPVDVKEQMIEWLGPKLVEFYAGSEGTGFFMIGSSDWLDHKGSVGKAVLGTPHVLDDDGNELPAGEIGTVWFADIRPFAYHHDEDKTASAFNDRGWNTLGDLGRLDDEGYLYLSDRRTDLILSGGVNIYPREIEDVLALHPAVADIAVLGIPDAEFGQSVHAVVDPAGGVQAGPELEQLLKAYLRERIAGYKVPRSFTFGAVPRLPSGKILRRELITRFEV